MGIILGPIALLIYIALYSSISVIKKELKEANIILSAKNILRYQNADRALLWSFVVLLAGSAFVYTSSVYDIMPFKGGYCNAIINELQVCYTEFLKLAVCYCWLIFYWFFSSVFGEVFSNRLSVVVRTFHMFYGVMFVMLLIWFSILLTMALFGGLSLS